MTKSVLVTGANGFIGENLIPKLIQKKYKITVFGRRVPSSRQEVRYSAWDIAKTPLPLTALKNADAVVHLASYTNVNQAVVNPAKILNNNANMLFNVLESCRQLQHKPIIVFTSTDRVYGKTQKSKVDEQEAPYPIEPYTASKIYCEMLLEMYRHLYDINYIVLRLDSVYGPGQSRRMFISDVIQKMIKQDTITVGQLDIYKNSVFVGDVVQAILAAIETPRSSQNHIYNIGGKYLSLQKILTILQTKIQKKLNKKIQITFDSELKRRSNIEINAFCLNTRKSKKYLHWQPRTSLSEGLDITIDYFLKAKITKPNRERK